MRILRNFSLCLLFSMVLPTALLAFSGGPPLRRNWCGQQATQPICNGAQCGSCADSGCHADSPPNTGQGSVSILGLPPGGYDPSVALPYVLNVLLEDPNNGNFNFGGFEVSAMLGSDLCQAGTLTRDVVNEPFTDDPTDFVSGVTFVQHIQPKPQSGGQVIWSFLWDPPAPGSGDVVFNVCGNAADRNGGSNSNDSIYCTELVVSEAVDCSQEPPGTPCDDGFECTDPDECVGAGCVGTPRDAFCDAIEAGSTCQPGTPNADPVTGCVPPAGAEDCTTPDDEDGQGDGGTCPDDPDCTIDTPCIPDAFSCTDDLCQIDPGGGGITCQNINNDGNCAPGQTCDPSDPSADPTTGCVLPAGAEDCTTPADEDGEGDGGTCPDSDCPSGSPCIPDAFSCTVDECGDDGGGTIICLNTPDDGQCGPGQACNPNDPNADPTTGCAAAAGAEDCSTLADEDGDGAETDPNCPGDPCCDTDCWCDFGNCGASANADCDGDFVANSTDCAPQDVATWFPGVETGFVPSPLGGSLAATHSIVKLTQAPPGDPTGDLLFFLWANQQLSVGQSTVFDLVTGNAADFNAGIEPFENAECFTDPGGNTVNDLPPFGLLPFSVPGEVCGDLIDNDGDQLLDCLDPECFGDATCPESTFPQGCNDFLDNDGDFGVECPNCGIDCPVFDATGLIAGDTDCLAAPECWDIFLPLDVVNIGGGATTVQWFLPRAQNVCNDNTQNPAPGTIPATYGDGSEPVDARDFLDLDPADGGPVNACP